MTEGSVMILWRVRYPDNEKVQYSGVPVILFTGGSAMIL